MPGPVSEHPVEAEPERRQSGVVVPLHPAAVPPPVRSYAQLRARALRLVMLAALLEVLLILPFVDHLADANPTIHFTQHGFIFLGGVLMGVALRDVHRGARSQ
jgi:hypothetical protein